jgi:hypothetical protein
LKEIQTCRPWRDRSPIRNRIGVGYGAGADANADRRGSRLLNSSWQPMAYPVVIDPLRRDNDAA